MIVRTFAIMRKEVLHIIRDPRTLMLIFLIPIIQMVLLGYAANTDIDHIALVVLDGDHSPESRSMVRAFDTTTYFDVVYYAKNEAEMAEYIDRGEARAALVIPATYGLNVMEGQPTQIGFVVDGSDPTTANSVLAAGLQIGQATAAQATLQAGVGQPGIELRPTVWYNPGLKSVNYMIPALMGLVLQFLATLLTSMAIVRERESGTMEQLIVTPIKPFELVLGKTIPYVAVSFFNLVEVLAVGVFWFKVPIHGSIGLLLGLSGLFLLGSLGIGIVISSTSSTQQEAMLWSFMILLPSIFLSGFLFPLEAMPWALRMLSYVVPLRYMLTIVRGIVLKGVALSYIQTEVVFLGVFCVVMLGLASVRFRKNLM